MTAVDKRELIFSYIKSHPGTHLRQIKRDLGISMGVTQHHLYMLEKEGTILSRRNGLYKRFFPSLLFGEHQKDILDVLSLETERDFLLYLIQNPSSTQKELSEYSRISPGSINWHMKRLVNLGLVSVRREGQFVRYSVNGGSEVINLVLSYHPSLWELWVDRLANAIDSLSESDAEDKGLEERDTVEQFTVTKESKNNVF